MTEKRCSCCSELKPIDQFHKLNTAKDGRQSACIICRRLRCKASRENKIQHYNEVSRAYREANKEKRRSKAKMYVKENIEILTEKSRAYRKANAEKSRSWHREYTRKRNKDPKVKLIKRFRNLIFEAFNRKGFKKNSSTFNILNCDYETLVKHIGTADIPDGWHIDHICPCSQARDFDELLKLQHFTNLRLLPAKDNIAKNNNPTDEAVHKCRELLGRDWI